ncbi:NlpC/P60 family protein [Brotaphodocola sp.]|uniref:C40 family peptidase n=1 Tax=Brotaphodocola sp. TaxID=3073577 RepID=UPI003D7E2023
MKKTIRMLTLGCVCAMTLGVIPAYADVQKSQHTVSVVASQGNYENIAVSQVSDYVNIRENPNTDSTIVGKIYNNCAATILETVEGEGGKWYRIQSGAVTGYIKAQYFVTGDAAEQLARSIRREFVTISADGLRLRAEPNLTSTTLTLLSQGAEYIVVDDEGDFFKVEIDEDLVGYISKNYCTARVEFDQAVTLQEEKEKKAEEEKRKQEADSAIAQLEEVRRVEAKEEAEESQTGNNGTTIAPNPSGTDSSANGGSTPATSNPSSDNGATIIATKPDEVETTSPAQNNNNNNSNSSGNSGTSGSGTSNGNSSSTSTKPSATVVQPSNTTTSSGTTTAGTSDSKNSATIKGSGGPGSTAVVTATRTAIVAYAKQFLGNKYVYGGTSLTTGADCSGFTQAIFAHFGITTGRTSRDQAQNVKTIPISSVQPGDLLFYGSGSTITHVAIYIGDGKVIHSSNSRTGVIISPYNYRTPSKAGTFLN